MTVSLFYDAHLDLDFFFFTSHIKTEQLNDGLWQVEDKDMAIRKVCQAIHKRMYQLDASSNTSRNFKYVKQISIYCFCVWFIHKQRNILKHTNVCPSDSG